MLSQNFTNGDIVATAHANDNSETINFKIFKGYGILHIIASSSLSPNNYLFLAGRDALDFYKTSQLHTFVYQNGFTDSDKAQIATRQQVQLALNATNVASADWKTQYKFFAEYGAFSGKIDTEWSSAILQASTSLVHYDEVKTLDAVSINSVNSTNESLLAYSVYLSQLLKNNGIAHKGIPQ